MKNKERVIFDIGQEKFKYLQRDVKHRPKNPNMFELNQKLNQTKKKNFYTNTKIISCALLGLWFIVLISMRT
jgi:hypothetical protein